MNISFGWSYELDCNCEYLIPHTPHNPVENLTGNVTSNAITLTWAAPADAINFIVSRNGIEIGQTAEASYTEEIALEGTYSYCVVAEYADGLSVPQCIVLTADWGIGENEASFSIYPNPASNMLYVNGGDTEFAYEMFNGMGQMAVKGNGHGTVEISVNNLQKGVYFLRLTSGTQVRLEKVVVE